MRKALLSHTLVSGGALLLFISLRVIFGRLEAASVAQIPPCKDCRPAVTLVQP